MDKLRDIKDIVEVEEYSLLLLITLILLAIFLIVFAIYLYKNRRIKTKRLSKKQIAKEKLKNIDFNDTKNIAYTFSEYFVYFVNDKNKDEFENIEKQLENYKYKKEVESLPQDIKHKIQGLIRGVK